MSDDTYEAPTIKVLGEVTDLTQGSVGIYFDFPGAATPNDVPPS